MNDEGRDRDGDRDRKRSPAAIPTPDGVIRSAANGRYRALLRLLEDARARRTGRLTVLEGHHLLSAWLGRGGSVVDWAVAEAGAATAVEAVAGLPGAFRLGAPIVLADRLLDRLSELKSPAPVLAVIESPALPLPALLTCDLVILDRIQDPANVGAIIRTVAAAGLPTLVTTPGTAACWSPKCLRAGMGGQFAVAIHEGAGWPTILASLRVPLAATVVRGGSPLAATDLRAPLAWCFGNEGEGIGDEMARRATVAVTIDQEPGVESLNVGAAVAICLFEQRRQRCA